MNKTTNTNEIDYTKATSIYDFVVKDTYQMDVKLSEYCQGIVTLIVNIGSACGLTAANYDQLTQINKDFDGSKFEILAIPFLEFQVSKMDFQAVLFCVCIFPFLFPELRILIFPCNQFMDQMPESDGDEMLCHFKKRNAAPGAIFAKVRCSTLFWPK